MITKLNKEIINEALKTGEPIRWSFVEGNRNIVAVGDRKFFRVRPIRFHKDMREAGFKMSDTANRFYSKEGI